MLKQIGKYTISERIGRGTYSRVYRAVDSQGRAVAIKVSTTPTDPEHLAAFQKDLVAAASVLNPNLVAVHDLGFEDDFPYLVMELVEGRDLDKLLKSNAAPSLAERIRVMQQVGGALKSAHERGVFHLDVRPSKIMLGDDGAAKLLDLGLGRLSFDPARETEHGYLVGAPFYMSPERLTAIDTANEHCDIWSFGVTFYEWISGRHPFYDDDGDRMIGNIMDATPADLANVPAALNHIILRAMEKDPADRYSSFADLLADLQPLVSDLKREESDALMAEALKQTDSGRWHEARRIARKMRDLEPQQGAAAGSQMFGFSEPDYETPERVRPAAESPIVSSPVQPLVAAAAIAAATAATAVDTPEPAPPPPPPPPVQRRTSAPPVAAAPQASVATPPKPQRPERTAPKIPSIGARNGATVSTENGNGTTPIARVAPTPAPAPPKAAYAAAAAAAPASSSSVVREVDTTPRVEPTRTRPPSNPTRTVPPPQQHATVRILEMEEPSGFPWVKILGFAIPALLMIGLLFFFMRPSGKILKTSNGSEEAKEISPASRVIKGGDQNDAGVPIVTPPSSTETAPVTPPAGTANNNNNAQPNAATVASAINPADPTSSQPPAPRAFDPKSLVLPKVTPPNRRKTNGSLAAAAPSIGGNPEPTDTAALPVGFNAIPPPAPVAPPPPAAVKPASVAPVPSPAPSAQPPTVQAVQESATHIGGAFSQPVLLKSVPPIYPPAAVQRKAQGVVRFQATIAKDGSVKNIQLLSGDPLLNVAARQAVTQWKYQPAMLNGDPVEVTQGIVVKFSLSNQ